MHHHQTAASTTRLARVLFAPCLILTVLLSPPPTSGYQAEVDPTVAPGPVFREPGYTGKVAGRVINADGDPVAGAELFYSPTWNSLALTDLSDVSNADMALFLSDTKHETRTDENGNFRFVRKLRINPDCHLNITHPDYGWSRFSGLGDQIEITLTRGISLSGRITAQDGNPLADAVVSVIRPRLPRGRDLSIGVARTDANGGFELRHVPEDQITRLEIKKSGFEKQILMFLPDSVEQPAEESTRSAQKPVYVRNQFVFQMPQVNDVRTVRIAAVDSRIGKPVAISWGLRKAYGGIFFDRDPEYELPNCGENCVEFSFSGSRPGPHRFWIQPKPGSGFLGAYVDAVPKAGESIEKVAKLAAGAIVSGTVVDEQSSDPIAGVAIGYYPDNRAELESQGMLLPGFVTTDEDGAFRMIVPMAGAELKMVGRVPGYITLPPLHSSSLSDEIRTRYVRKIEPVSDSGLSGLKFRLPRNSSVSGTVRYPNGRPAPNVNFMFDYTRKSGISSAYGREFGRTDDNGSFAINSLFDNALIRIGELPEEFEERRGQGRMNDVARITGGRDWRKSRIVFWEESRELVAVQEITFADARNKTIELDVILKAAPVAKGRVVDAESGSGVGGIEVEMFNGPGMQAMQWRTRTNSRGEFFFTCLLPNDVALDFSKGE